MEMQKCHSTVLGLETNSSSWYVVCIPEMGRFRFRNRNWNRNWHFFQMGGIGIGIGIESTSKLESNYSQRNRNWNRKCRNRPISGVYPDNSGVYSFHDGGSSNFHDLLVVWETHFVTALNTVCPSRHLWDRHG